MSRLAIFSVLFFLPLLAFGKAKDPPKTPDQIIEQIRKADKDSDVACDKAIDKMREIKDAKKRMAAKVGVAEACYREYKKFERVALESAKKLTGRQLLAAFGYVRTAQLYAESMKKIQDCAKLKDEEKKDECVDEASSIYGEGAKRKELAEMLLAKSGSNK